MYIKQMKSTSLIKGGQLLLYLGIALFGFAIFTAMYLPPIPSKTIYIDDGCLRITEGNMSPADSMFDLGYPLSDKDIIHELVVNEYGDRLYRIDRSKQIRVEDYNNCWTVNTFATCLRRLAEEEKDKFALSDLDRIEPSLDTHLEDGMVITVTRVTTEDVTEEEKMYAWYDMIPDDKLPRGKVTTVKWGEPGMKEVTYRKFYKNGELTLTKKIGEKITKPVVPGVKHVGSRVMTMSRSGYRGKRILEMEATAYDIGPKSTGKWSDGLTATGKKATYGIVAVDPKVIPLGTKLFVEGYGYAVAEDVGGAIKGLRIDLLFESRKEALKFGRRKVKVYILEE